MSADWADELARTTGICQNRCGCVGIPCRIAAALRTAEARGLEREAREADKWRRKGSIPKPLAHLSAQANGELAAEINAEDRAASEIAVAIRALKP